MTLQDRPDARGGDDDTHGGELTVDSAVAQFGSLARRSTTAVVPSAMGGRPGRPWEWVQRLATRSRCQAQKSCRLDEEVPETLAGEQSCQSGQHRSICWLERRAVHLASEDRHLVAQHDDFDGEVRISATDEADQLKYAAVRPVEEREGHGPGSSPRLAPAVKVQLTADR